MRSFEEQARMSVMRDFRGAHFNRPAGKRVKSVSERCEYWRFRSLIVGRLVRITSEKLDGVWVQFVFDEDRLRLNRAAGWSDSKKDYLLQGAKFDV